MEPVVAAPEEPYSIREEDLPQIMDEYDRLAKEFVKRQKEGRGFISLSNRAESSLARLM